jgi:DNA ligase-1
VSDLADGDQTEIQGSGKAPYVLRNTGGVFSCTCPAWRNQSVPIERRTCKHLKALRGEEVELKRIGSDGAAVTSPPKKSAATSGGAVPPLLLAHTWENDVKLTGWWMSEKLDGVRAYWDGNRFLSRLGNEYAAPEWFTQGLPSHPLDGELWAGRMLFQKAVSIARRQDKGAGWKELTYTVFDAPAHPHPFEERVAFARAAVAAAKNPYVKFLEHERCEGVDHLKKELARVEGLGGEGLMLRRPASKYEIGRSSTLLKVKSFKDDEAKVLGHVPGSGKFSGMLGALEVQLKDGTRFSVGTGFSDAERKAPVPIGTIVTVRYQELSKDGVPRFPSYVGVRDDVKFVEVAPGQPPKVSHASARRFERGLRFWEIELNGTEYTVHFGVQGGPNHQDTKTFSTVWAAAEAALARVAENVGRGYVEK